MVESVDGEMWRSLPFARAHVDLQTLLTCGQSFTWKETGNGVWSNVLNRVVFSLKQTPTEVLWRTPFRDQSMPLKSDNDIAITVKQEVVSGVDDARCVDDEKSHSGGGKKGKSIIPKDTEDNNLAQAAIGNLEEISSNITDKDAESILRDYFQLDVDLPTLYKQWSQADKNFDKISDSFTGIRIMRQDPTENLFSFICSSNNHVSRISGMVNKLAEFYGTKLGSLGDKSLYSFPSAADLDQPDVENHLRQLGFGYRAKYIAATAKILNKNRPVGWLNTLRSSSYEECITELTKLQGVGRKVADCVALMSLDKPHVVPVDTHVLQIAARDYRIPGVGKDMKSLTPAIHDKIGQYFVQLYGDYAGWAHTVLFAADLKRFSNHVPAKPLKVKAKSERKEVKPPTKKAVVKKETGVRKR